MPDLAEATRAALNEYMNRAHCAEVVFKYTCKAWHPGFDESLVRLGTPFGGGIADRGNVCGALIGGLLVIGYLFGRRSLTESQTLCRELSGRYHDAFKGAFQDTTCYGIRGRIFNWDTHVKCSNTVSRSMAVLWEVVREAEARGQTPWRT
ncbi:MAG: C-GCAxxG-C-C family protein [Chloroflexota bacterium]|nr:C-GCAxxG-C-C family protein [Chloroflexota bacterium]